MKIELKSIKYSPQFSEETLCFQANLYINGKNIGIVSNDGRGGCDRFHGDREAYKKADDWCKHNIPPSDSDFGPLAMDLELFCALAVEKHNILKEIKKLKNGKIAFYNPSKKNFFTIKVPKGLEETAAKNHKKQHPDYEYINGLSEEEAYKLYTKPEEFIAAKIAAKKAG